MKFFQALKEEKIKDISHRKAITIEKSTTFFDVVQRLQESKCGCAVVVEAGRVIGILTERDLLKRGLLGQASPSTPAEQMMTPNPKVIEMEDNLAVAIGLMHQGKYRHLPMVDAAGKLLGLISVRDIVFFLSELYPKEVYNQPPDPHMISATQEGA